MSIQKYIDSLHKDELIYELNILGVSSGENVNVDVLRKQIRQVFRLARRGSLKCPEVSQPSSDSEIEICTPKVLDLENQLESVKVVDKNLFAKLSRRANYLIDRLARISETKPGLTELRGRIVKLLSLLDGDEEDSFSECEEPVSERKEESKIVYVKDKPINLNTLNLKYDGTSCVRVFIERLEELRCARNISEEHLLLAFPDLLESSALYWYRSNKSNFSNYSQLLKSLRDDFDIPDLDYKLKNEIRKRTQSRTETIVVYISIMQGMFSRLSTPIAEREQLDILLHNVRPEYIKELALHKITTIEELKSYCKKLELARSRAEQFTEPDQAEFKITPDLNKILSTSTKRVNKQISAFNRSSNVQGQVKKCFRCNKNTHFTNECTSREVVCFKCGKRGVKRSDCDSCKFPKN